eukprot:COSAG02_NODE_67910_length_252_cov_0.444444_1_plen_32_part_10
MVVAGLVKKPAMGKGWPRLRRMLRKLRKLPRL